MITVKLGQLDAAVRGGALPKLANDDASPPKTTFRIARLCKQAFAEWSAYEQKRLALLAKYAKTDKDGNVVFKEDKNADFKTAEDHDNYQKDTREILDTDLELLGEVFTLDDFYPRAKRFDPSTNTRDEIEFLSAHDMIALEWLIVEAHEAATPPAKKESDAAA